MFEVSTIKNGSKGKNVLLVQKILRADGYYKGSLDGDFGGNTKKAVKEYQKSHNLTADGVVGKNTWSKVLGL